MNRLGEVIQNSYSQFFILLIASIQSLRSPKAVRRIYPSPLGPKPTPGVPTDVYKRQVVRYDDKLPSMY